MGDASSCMEYIQGFIISNEDSSHLRPSVEKTDKRQYQMKAWNLPVQGGRESSPSDAPKRSLRQFRQYSWPHGARGKLKNTTSSCQAAYCRFVCFGDFLVAT
jgi:hypothetical protein